MSLSLDLLGQPLPARGLLFDHPVEPSSVAPKLCRQGRNGFSQSVAEAHKDSVAFSATLSTTNDVVFLATSSHIGNMDDVFPQRTKLRDDILAYRREHGLTPDQMAIKLQRSPSSLKSILYDRTRLVGTDFIKIWAGISGRSITEYIDDPGTSVPGVPQEAFADATEQERVMMRAMGSDLSRLTTEQRRAAFEAWSAIVRGISGK
jgi:hypothetical protein